MERSETNKKYQWKTEDIFPSDEAWEALFAEAEKALDFSAFEGKLADKAELIKFFAKEEEAGKMLERLHLYAHMRHDEDTRVAKYTAMQSRAMSLYVRFSSATAFAEPELTALPEAALRAFAADPEFANYDYFFRQLIKSKDHILSAKEERLIAMGGEMYSQFSNVFSMIDNADIRLGKVEDKDGKPVKLTHGLYGVFMHSADRALRERTFKRYYEAYISLTNSIAAAYYGNVLKDVFLAKARGYDSCLQRALDNEDVSVSVYENLISAVDKSLPVMHRYIALRKKILGLDEQHMYDIYAPLVADAEMELSYEEACELVIEGLAPLGKDYQALLRKGFDEGWVDVEETAGKRSGAYSTGVFGIHPYVLLNYRPTTSNVFTIAHEMGHAMHTYFSNANQPYPKADYRIFVAEVASTVNEVLLLKHILATSKDKNLKKYLLNYYLDTIRATLHRQTMFAEFEGIAHGMAENGQPLTSENLSEVYLELNKKYYGDAIVHDKEIAYEWSRIPHFYTSFYVYKYATGITSAISIAKRILTEGENAVKEYKTFLSSGGSSDPVSLLKLAGVDLTKKDAFETAMQEFEETLSAFEKAQ